MPPSNLPRGRRHMSARERELPSVMNSCTQEGDVRPCYCMTSVSISTVELKEGHFVCLTLSRPDLNAGAVLVIDPTDELDPFIHLLRNAAEDAVLLDAGQMPVHTTGLAPSTKRH